VFAGTVNGNEYLCDESGNRRFWPVQCTRAQLDQLQRDRDQLWAEATRQFKQGEIWWLRETHLVQEAEREQAERVPQDPWKELIAAFISDRDDVSSAEILTDCIKKPPESWARKDEMRVGGILRGLKWIRSKVRLPKGGNSSQRRATSERRYRRGEK